MLRRAALIHSGQLAVTTVTRTAQTRSEPPEITTETHIAQIHSGQRGIITVIRGVRTRSERLVDQTVQSAERTLSERHASPGKMAALRHAERIVSAQHAVINRRLIQ